MKLKKTLSLTLTLLLMMSLIACKTNGNNDAPPQPQQKPEIQEEVPDTNNQSSNDSSSEDNSSTTLPLDNDEFLVEEGTGNDNTSNDAATLPLEPSNVHPIEVDKTTGTNKTNLETNTNTNISTKNELNQNFDEDFLNFIKSETKNENFMVSPLSFRYALALASYGAIGITQKELLNAMGFDSMDEYISWTSNINKTVSDFDTELKSDIQQFQNNKFFGENKPDRAFSVANSIWHNSDEEGKITDKYISDAAKLFSAMAGNVPSAELEARINEWVNENTNGLIPSLVGPSVKDANTVLVNTLYMKSRWLNPFQDYATKKAAFHTYDGKSIEKDFMNQKESFKYYEDSNTKAIVMPMEGGINMVFVLGDDNDIFSKLDKASYEDVKVSIPKFEVETSFNNKELIKYLAQKGVVLALDDTGIADFTPMVEGQDIYIDDIIQKTKVSIDENGAEAAAATTVLMMEATSAGPITQPKEFVANKPFSYYIYTNTDNGPEIMFYGQYVK